MCMWDLRTQKLNSLKKSLKGGEVDLDGKLK